MNISITQVDFSRGANLNWGFSALPAAKSFDEVSDIENVHHVTLSFETKEAMINFKSWIPKGIKFAATSEGLGAWYEGTWYITFDFSNCFRTNAVTGAVNESGNKSRQKAMRWLMDNKKD